MMRLLIKVVPKSSRNAVAGWVGEALKICVKEPPEKGRANKAVEAVLSEVLELPKERVVIVAGHASARKTVEINGLDEYEVRTRLPPR
ncbi:MAG TPA: DUF167 domain-containing protein [Nitrospiria bacterium]|nr:DUF167 domain-containing protein [Nitrospiria bacterium]